MSTRSLMISMQPAACVCARTARAKARNSLGDIDLTRSCKIFTPPSRSCDNTASGARPRVCSGSRMAYNGGRVSGIGLRRFLLELDAQLGDFFAYGVAVDAEDLRRAELINLGFFECQFNQRPFHSFDDQRIEVVDVDPFRAPEVVEQFVPDDLLQGELIHF